MSGGGWSSFISRTLSKETSAPTIVGFDLRLPTSQPNPDWYGTVELYIDAPSVGINNQPLGLFMLKAWTPNVWKRAEFAIPASMQTALNNNYTDLRWRIQLNVPSNATGQYLFDRFTLTTMGGGSCTPTSDNNPCTTDMCDANGQQQHTPVAAGTTCSDNNVCNGAETCNATGTCLAGTPLVTNDNNPCTTDACNPTTGVSHTPVATGTSCTDNNACNGAETCNASATCVAGTPPNLDDANPCTTDACTAGTGITHTPVATGTSCTDNNLCNGAETCNASAACVAGAPPAVDDGNPCTTDSCSPAAGVSHVPVSAGTSCTDGNACNGTETCNAAAVCLGGTPPPVDDNNPCTTDSCTPATGVAHVPVAAGTSCSDNNACNGAETCNAGGSCVPGTPVTCVASDQCHDAGTCNPSTGICPNPAKPNGSVCNDASACTQLDQCQSGSCVGSNPVVCAASDSCHSAGTCDPANGQCSNPVVADGTACPDGDLCNGGETCHSGACTAGTPMPVDDGNPCTVDTCSPIFGDVTHNPGPNGTSCADTNICNGAETCLAGVCAPGTPLDVDDDNPCTDDTCNPAQGAQHTPRAAGSSCSDFDLCNGSETCDASGVCEAGTPVPIDTSNPCNAGSCDPLTGMVTYAPAPAGTLCALDLCTDGTCNAAGECMASGSTAEDDGDPCSIEWCDPLLGPQQKRCSDLDRTLGTTLYGSMKWIYKQPNPVQIGVAPGTILAARAVAIRGVVRARDGSPLPGVKVTVASHAEFGSTTTQTNGNFDMVVNGGGTLVLDYQRDVTV